MEPSRNLINFENFRAKLALFPMEIGSSGGEHSHGYVPSTNLMCKRKAASDSTGIPGVTKYKKLLNSQLDGQDKLVKFPNFAFLRSHGTVFERSESGNSWKMCAEVPEGCHKLREKIESCGNKRSHTQSTSSFVVQGHKGLKLNQPSSGSTEGSRNFQHIGSSRFTIYNKLSAERSMDTCHFAEDKSTSGANYVTSAKDHINPTGSATDNNIKSFGEIGMPWKDSASVDANKQLLSLLVASSSAATSSRTPKVHPLIRFYDAEPPLQKPYLSEDDYCDDKWVKRLKLTSNSHDKAWKGFKSIHHSSTSQTEPSDSKRHGKESILSDEIHEGQKPLTGSVPSGGDGKNEGGVVLSHCWIQRFTRNGLDKKQFPNIAAMAVVRRTMNGHGSCKTQRKGSITTWSTNTF